MESSSQSVSGVPTARLWLAVIVVSALMFFWRLGLHHVTNVNEGLRLLPAAEMVERGDWVIPRIDGKPYINKPPLVYWIIAGSYKALGHVTPLAGRIPIAAICFLTVLALVGLGYRHGARTDGLWAGLILATAYYYAHKAQLADIDPVLTAAVLGGMYYYWLAVTAPAGEWIAKSSLAGLFFGAVLMLKGPVLFPFLLAALLAVWLTERPRISRMALCLGVSLLVGIALFAPWCILLVQRLGWDTAWAKLNEQALTRVGQASRINSGPIYYYLEHVGGGFLPWTPLLLLYLSRPFRAFCKTERTSFFRFAAAFAGIAFVIFSLIAGKETEYLLPIFPFLALACAPALAWLISRPIAQGPMPEAARIAFSVFGFLCVLAPAAFVTEFGYWIHEAGGLTVAMFAGASLIGMAGVIDALRRHMPRSALLVTIAMALLMTSLTDALKTRVNRTESIWPAVKAAEVYSARGIPVYRYKLVHPHQIWYLRKFSQVLPERDNDEAARLLKSAPSSIIITRAKSVKSLESNYGNAFATTKILDRDGYYFADVMLTRRPAPAVQATPKGAAPVLHAGK